MIGALAVFGAAGCGEKPSKQACEKLLSHMYEMDVRESGASKVTETQKKAVDKQIKAVKKKLRKKFMTQCMDRTPKAWIECAIEAKDKKGVDNCRG